MSTPPNVDPAFMDDLDQEAEIARRGNRPNRLDIPKGTGVVVRFLPVKLGSSQTWCARYGAHWHMKKHVNCPRTTGKTFGGAEDADCPVCTLVEEMLASPDKATQDTGHSVGSWGRYLTYVFVKDIVDKQGNIQPLHPRSVFTPQKLDIPSGAFLDLHRLHLRAKTKAAMGLVDPENGFWVLLQRDLRNFLSAQFSDDPGGPVREDLSAEDLAAWMENLCRGLKTENCTPSSYEELAAFANVIQNQVPVVDIEAGLEEQELPPAPVARSRTGAPPSGTAVAARPAGRAAAPPPPVRRTALAAPPAEPEASSGVEAELDAVPGHEDDVPPPVQVPPQAPRATTPARAAVATPRAPVAAPPRVATIRTPATASVAAAAPRRTLPPPPARRVAPPPESIEPEGTEEDVAPETYDPAPATEAPNEAPVEEAAEKAPALAVPRRQLSPAIARSVQKAG